MAIIYYPRGSIIMRRDTLSASYEQTALGVTPNTIIYFDTSSNLNYISASTIYHTASHALFAETASSFTAHQAIGVNLTLSTTHSIVYASASTQNLVLTLPPANNVTGQLFRIKKTDSSGYHIIISSSGNIDYDTELRLTQRGSSVTLHSDSTQYWIH